MGRRIDTRGTPRQAMASADSRAASRSFAPVSSFLGASAPGRFGVPLVRSALRSWRNVPGSLSAVRRYGPQHAAVRMAGAPTVLSLSDIPPTHVTEVHPRPDLQAGDGPYLSHGVRSFSDR